MQRKKEQDWRAEQIYHDKKASLGLFDEGDNYERIFPLFKLDNVHHNRELALDVGCGTDAYGLRLAKRGYLAIGIDISIGECLFARQRALKKGIKFPVVTGDLVALPFKSKTIDNVFCGGVLHHFPDPAPVVSEIKRVLKHESKLILVEPNGSNPIISLYFLMNRIFMGFGWESYYTVNETPHSVGKYVNILRNLGFKNIEVKLLPGSTFSSFIRQALMTIWAKIMPSTIGGMEIVITAEKFDQQDQGILSFSKVY